MKSFFLTRAAAWALALVSGVAIAQASGGAAGSTARGPSKPAAAKPVKVAGAYQIEPVPTWVIPAAETPNARVDLAPMHYRIIDNQIRLDATSVTEYTHVVRVVDNVDGLSAASQIELGFDPSYQSLALHHLEVVREGKRLNRLDRGKIQLLRRETQLERQMYDGRMTLSVVVDDVRVGDQIDYAYTVRGANPVFEGKYAEAIWMQSQYGPVALYALRLIAPTARAIQVRTGSPDMRVESHVAGALRETLVRREAVPQWRAEPGTPSSVGLAQQVQFSEYADWGDIAQWGRALFAQNGAGAALDQKASEIRAASSDRKAQLLAALDFVQKDIRYFGTEIGIGTHRPTAPDKVIEQRFGDCKDKVTLLVALLRRLEIEASPVLVSTWLRGRFDAQLPSPLAFDHVIARVDLDGTRYWLDGTRNFQGGTLAERQSIGLGQGLALVDGSNALVALPAAFDTERVSVADLIRIDKFTADPTLESRVTYHNDLAEMFRAMLASRGPDEVATELARPYLRVYPKAQANGPMRVESQAGEDAITFVREYTIPGFWRFPEEKALQADTVRWGLADALAVPKSETRRDAIGLTLPGVYRHTTTIDFPEDVYGSEPLSQHFDDGDANVSLKTTAEAQSRRLVYTAQARVAVDQVEAKDWPAFSAKVSALLPHLATSVNVPAVPRDRIEALGRDIKAADASVREKRVRITSRVQADALLKSLVLSAEIDGGRLAPPFTAQALTARGIQYDHLGRYDSAAKDFARALEITPTARETQEAAAVNAIDTRRFDQAIEFANAALQQMPGDSEALGSRAMAKYFKKDLDGAKADYQELLKDKSQVRRGYPIVWLSMAMRQSGQDPASLASAYPAEQLAADWPRPLVDLAVGKKTADEVIQSAKTAKVPPEALCEAYFYIGEKYYSEGDASRAAEFWHKSIDQGVVEFVEDGGSRLRLAGVGAKS